MIYRSNIKRSLINYVVLPQKRRQMHSSFTYLNETMNLHIQFYPPANLYYHKKEIQHNTLYNEHKCTPLLFTFITWIYLYFLSTSKSNRSAIPFYYYSADGTLQRNAQWMLLKNFNVFARSVCSPVFPGIKILVCERKRFSKKHIRNTVTCWFSCLYLNDLVVRRTVSWLPQAVL